MSGEKEILLSIVGNAYKLQLYVVNEIGDSIANGKPVVLLDTAEDAALGKAVRDLFQTRIRTPRTKTPAERGGVE